MVSLKEELRDQAFKKLDWISYDFKDDDSFQDDDKEGENDGDDDGGGGGDDDDYDDGDGDDDVKPGFSSSLPPPLTPCSTM